MYRGHHNRGITEVDSCKVDFLKDEFLSINEIKKDVKLYELQQDVQPFLSERKVLNSRQVTEDGTLSYANGTVETWLPRTMRFILNL